MTTEREQGFRDGLEAAAKVCDEEEARFDEKLRGLHGAHQALAGAAAVGISVGAGKLARAIRALVPARTEESDNG